MSDKWTVSVFLCDRAYGGPEEGGWWYTKGELVRLVRVFSTQEAATAFCNRLDSRLDRTINKGRRPISSVLSSGRYSGWVYRHAPPFFFPATRLHYE